MFIDSHYNRDSQYLEEIALNRLSCSRQEYHSSSIIYDGTELKKQFPIQEQKKHHQISAKYE